MEKLLARLAQQLDAIDEASLMSLWSKYATTASRFEPTKRWEEAALIFSLIQAKRWKNQLFNFHWSRQTQERGGAEAPAGLMPGFELEPKEPEADVKAAARCRVLAFRPSDAGDGKAGDKEAGKTERSAKPDKNPAGEDPVPPGSGR